MSLHLLSFTNCSLPCALPTGPSCYESPLLAQSRRRQEAPHLLVSERCPTTRLSVQRTLTATRTETEGPGQDLAARHSESASPPPPPEPHSAPLPPTGPPPAPPPSPESPRPCSVLVLPGRALLACHLLARGLRIYYSDLTRCSGPYSPSRPGCAVTNPTAHEVQLVGRVWP